MSDPNSANKKTLLEEVHAAQRDRAGRIASKAMQHVVVPWVNTLKTTLKPTSRIVTVLEIIEAGQKKSQSDDRVMMPMVGPDELRTDLFLVIMRRTVEAEGICFEISEEKGDFLFTVSIPTCTS